MIKIAHRGNVTGPSYKENQPSHITDAISLGYDAEIDIWKIKDNLWLGHDGPQYLVTESFLSEVSASAWFHCKNLEALHFFNTIYPNLNYFWHQEDDFTLTSQGYIWTYPEKNITNKSVLVKLDNCDISNLSNKPFAICSDFLL